MKKSATIQFILQSILTPEEVESVMKSVGYEDKARKFTVNHLLHYWCMAAFEEWPGYHSGADRATSSGLTEFYSSSFSGKAADVPFNLFHLLVRKCNRETRRTLTFPKELLLIDSTTRTVGKTRLPWPHGERAGIKLHVALGAENGHPLKVIETVGSRHDGPVSEDLTHTDYIMVMDRAYGKLERLDRHKQDGQSFVIRLRDNIHFGKPCALRRQTKQKFSRSSGYYVSARDGPVSIRKTTPWLMFHDFEGREIRVVTDLMQVTAEQIAQMYKARWKIEVFFRWIKQHLKFPPCLALLKMLCMASCLEL
ncbi:Transposase DDE domain-containing protein [Paenibacillus sophorae]|uniref:IS4 family transposase n=1 Tax=Paenibacillus sophorae TaxID=1333845 RepID=A0A1H8J2E8_9BACL|nr:IS4 family transposase [Paenibacillus sophorae]QWU16167.1 IS4 family transposase [Paenibacillus sophorae]SEN74387.1 Transposase DDE domain-containing protein [Paenibacillus sophorae]